MAHIPSTMGPHLESVDFNSAGGLFLSSSGLTNRYWMGSVWYYDDPDLAPDIERCAAGQEVDCGISEIILLPGTDIVIGAADSGSVLLWRLTDNGHIFSEEAQLAEHDDIVSSVSCTADKKQIVSGSHDQRIKLWDIQEQASVATFKGHHGMITCVASHPEVPSVFVSSSQDGRHLLWDLRQSKPASKIETSHLPSSCTCVAWQPGKEHQIVVGTETGHLVSQDTRWSVGTPFILEAHKRPVTKLKFAPHKTHWLASASEDCRVMVSDVEAGKVIYHDNSHNDFVRGISWDPKSHRLFSCGWDTRVIGRDVAEDENLSSPLSTLGIQEGQVAKGHRDVVMEDQPSQPQCNGHVQANTSGVEHSQAREEMDTKS